MPEYIAPGIYVEEVSSGNKPIEGVSTSTAGFVGGAERGPLAPQFISSWLEFRRVYGNYYPDQSFLAYAVEGFFTNGGQLCFISRVVPDADSEYAKSEISPSLHIAAIGPGEWGTHLQWTLEPATQATADPANKGHWVKLTIEYSKDNIVEQFDNLSHETGASNNIIRTVNASSKLVRLWWDDPAAPQPLTASSQATTLSATAVNAAANLTTDNFKGSSNPNKIPGTNHGEDLFGRGSGLAALELIDEIAILVVPDAVHPNVADSTNIRRMVLDQAESLKDRFAIFSAVQGHSDVNTLNPPYDSSYAGFYYPWIKVFDPSINFTRLIPPSGHVAGIFARTDIERGVHKAPANEIVRGVLDLEFPITKAKQDILNPRGVNCLRDFRSDGRGIRLWGARTMSSDPEWKYVNVRRLFLYIEESIEKGIKWVKFEPNDDNTWATVRRSITSFLINVWRSGALMGLTQDEAFFVICDRTTMTQDDIDNGILIAVIGVAPVKPAEFVIFRISQKTADAPA